VSKLSVSALQQLHPNSARPFCSSSLVFFFILCSTPWQVQWMMSHATTVPSHEGYCSTLAREVKKHTERIDADVQVTNERIGVLEATQLATDTKLGTMEASVTHIDNSLAALLRCFDVLMTREHDRHQGITTTTTTMMNRSMTIEMSILPIRNLMTTTPAV
jgi:hypothetical protein